MRPFKLSLCYCSFLLHSAARSFPLQSSHLTSFSTEDIVVAEVGTAIVVVVDDESAEIDSIDVALEKPYQAFHEIDKIVVELIIIDSFLVAPYCCY